MTSEKGGVIHDVKNEEGAYMTGACRILDERGKGWQT